MKKTKKLILTMLAVLACMSASAQVKFGAKVGLDLTNYWGKETNHSILLNYQAGLLMEYKFHPHFAVAPEVVFAAQGGKSYGKVTQYNPKGKLDADYLTYRTNYINVPVMLKYYLAQDFSLDCGPQVGFNVYSKYTGVSGKAEDCKSWTNAVDLGLGMGCTYSLDEHMFMQVRYTMGLTKVFDDSCGGVIIPDYRKNGNIQLAFGAKF